MTDTAKDRSAARVFNATHTHVDTILIAMSAAKVAREAVNIIQRHVLADQNYYGREHDGRQVRITDPKRTHLLDKQSADAYYARLNAIHLADGFKPAANGHCPALTAEALQVEAENTLIVAAEPYFPGMTNARLLRGSEKRNGVELRRKYLDLLIKLVVNSPGYCNPLTGKAVHDGADTNHD